MAKINLSVGQNGYEAWMNVSETIPSDYITGNYTKVNIDLILKNGNKRTNTNGWTFLIQVNGSDTKKLTGQNLNSTVVSYHESYTVISVSGVNVPHNEDGTKSVYIYGKLEKDHYGTYDPGFVGGGGNVTLTTIPRASAVSVSSDPTLGGNAVTISCSRASDSFTHTLRVINPNNTSNYVETFTNVGASKSWVPPLFNGDTPSEYTSIITGESKQFTISCETFNGSTSLGSKTCTTTIHVPNQSNTKPTMNGGEFSRTDANSVARGWGVLVQSKSRLTFSVQPVCKANSSAASAQVNVDGTTYSGNASNGTASVAMSKVLQNAGSVIVKCNVIDSRGFKSYDSTNPSDWLTMEKLKVLPYTTPEFTIQPTVSRCKIENSSPVLYDLGEYVVMTFRGRVSAVSTDSATHKNSSASLKISWKPKSSSSYGSNDNITISGTYNSSSDDYVFEKTNFVLAKSGTNVNIGQSTEYDIKFELTDAFNTSSNPIVVYKSIGVGADLLNFNSNGKAIGIGQLSTATGNDAKLEIGMPTYIKGNLFLNGVPVGTVVNDMTSDSTTNAPSIHAVNNSLWTSGRTDITDCNNMLKDGVYGWSGTTANSPLANSWGTLLTLNNWLINGSNDNTTVQLATVSDSNDERVYFRERYGSNGWGTWKSIYGKKAREKVDFYSSTNRKTSSTTDVDISGASKTLITYGGDLLITTTISANVTGNMGFISLYIDNTLIEEVLCLNSGVNNQSITASSIVTGLSAGSHTIKLKMKVQKSTNVLTINNYNTNKFTIVEL